MKTFKIIGLWALVIILCITIYNYGKIKYYWYENTENPGRGHSIKTYQGENLGQYYTNGEKYKYTSITYNFEKDAELRSIIIILIIAASFFFSFKINNS